MNKKIGLREKINLRLKLRLKNDIIYFISYIAMEFLIKRENINYFLD
jgi:hypothetical protein